MSYNRRSKGNESQGTRFCRLFDRLRWPHENAEKIGWNRPGSATARSIAASFAAVQAGRSGRQERERDARRRGTHAHPSAEKTAFESRGTSTNRYSSLVQYKGTSGYWKLFRAMAI